MGSVALRDIGREDAPDSVIDDGYYGADYGEDY